MRLARPLALIAVAFAVGACASFDPGWTFAPAPSVTPLPSTAASASAGPSDGGSSAAPSDAAGGPSVELSAQNVKFSTDALTAPADTAFSIVFQNDDNGIPHNVAIKDPGGTLVFTGEIFNGVDKRTYAVPPLAAGSYTFLCTVHPTMTGTLTVQ